MGLLFFLIAFCSVEDFLLLPKQEQLLAREHRKESQKRKQRGAGAEEERSTPPPGVAGDIVVENVDEMPRHAACFSFAQGHVKAKRLHVLSCHFIYRQGVCHAVQDLT